MGLFHRLVYARWGVAGLVVGLFAVIALLIGLQMKSDATSRASDSSLYLDPNGGYDCELGIASAACATWQDEQIQLAGIDSEKSHGSTWLAAGAVAVVGAALLFAG